MKQVDKTHNKPTYKQRITRFIKGVAVALCISICSTTFAASDKLKVPVNSRVEYMTDDEDKMLEILSDETGINTNDNDNFVILYAALKNEQLEPQEKMLLYDLSRLIDDNKYINRFSAFSNISNLDIEYVDRPAGVSDSILGVFDLKRCVISIYQPEDEANTEILIHEIIHAIFTNENTINLPTYLIEGCTELLANEYFARSPFAEFNTYPFEVTIVKMLCEMIGEDNVLKTYTTGDLNIIESELTKVMDSKDVTVFMNDLNNIFSQFEDRQKINEESYNNIINFMDNYYLKKYTDYDKYDKYLYNRGIIELLNKESPYQDYFEYIRRNGTYEKAYFSTNMKKKFNKEEFIYHEKKSKKYVKK